MADTTSNLNILIRAQDMASGPLNAIHASMSKIGSVAGGVGGVIKGFAGHIAGLFGAVKNLVLSPAGLLGMLGGLAGITAILKTSVTAANDFGAATARMSKITGLSVDTSSQLLAVFRKFGIDGDTATAAVGMLEKNVGLLSVNAKAAKTFYSEFGFAIRDSSGHVKDANALILQAADYFNNKSIPASKKAALEAKLFGRNWQALVPILSLGSKGIADAEAQAVKLGLTMTAQNAGALAKYRESMRNLGEATGGLKLQIGNALIPVLTQMATWIHDRVVPAAQELLDKIRAWLDLHDGLIINIKKLASEALAGLWGYIKDGIGFIQNLIGVLQTLAGGSVLGFLWGQLQVGISFFSGIVDGVRAWLDGNQPLVDQLKAFGDFLSGRFNAALGGVQGALDNGIIPAIINAAGAVANYIIPKFIDFITTMIGPGGVVESVGKVVGPLIGPLIDAFGKVVHALFDAGGLIPAIGKLISDLWGGGSGPLALAVIGIGGLFTWVVGTVLPPLIDMLKNNLPVVMAALALTVLPPLTAGFYALAAGVIASTWPLVAAAVAIWGVYNAAQAVANLVKSATATPPPPGAFQGGGSAGGAGGSGTFTAPPPGSTTPPGARHHPAPVIAPRPMPGAGGGGASRGMAVGGSLMWNDSVIVGEHGPEMFRPGISGRIMQAGATARMGGGYAPAGPINVQVDGRNLLTFIDQRLYVAVQAAGGGYRPR